MRNLAFEFLSIRCQGIYLFIVLMLSACSAFSDTFLHTKEEPLKVISNIQPTPPGSVSSTNPQSQVLTPAMIQTNQEPAMPLETTFKLDKTSSITPTSLPPDYWMSLPVIPAVSRETQAIFKHGLELGRNPHAFSKIGDCQSITTYFLMYFDLPGFYNLGIYSSLQDTIDWYSGSFSRESLSVKGGFNAAAILSPFRADPKVCNPDENPIACEFRLHNPSIALISLEEWWTDHPKNYERYLRQIIEYSIDHAIVPILATKADNLEGNHLINQTIARLSLEYDIPLWNFWLAVQPLPNHGLIKFTSSGEVDMFHLTHSKGYFFYDDPSAPMSGWSMRNLSALQALDAVRHGLIDKP